MGTLEGGAGVGHLRDLSHRALIDLARIAKRAEGELGDQRPKTSIAQNADGSLFFTATVVDQPVKVRWAFMTREGDQHPVTGFEPESAVREACRLGPWDVDRLLDDLAKDSLDIAEVAI